MPDATSEPTTYDAELRQHNRVLREAAGVRQHDRALDIGCGSGLTTREAARAARDGSALGVDISAAAIRRARDTARAEGLDNVAFARADAEVYGFAPESFDLAISRFGTMFFHDPVVAFANIKRALRPDGRLVMMVWQSPEDNEWAAAIHRALTTPPASPGLDAFSLAAAASVEQILTAVRFPRLDRVHPSLVLRSGRRCFGPVRCGAWPSSGPRQSSIA